MKLTITILGVIALLAIGLVMGTMWHSAKLAAKESGQRALIAESCRLLEEYKSEHGTYPEALAALPLTYPDGGRPELLNDIAYASSGNAFTLSAVGYSSGQRIETSSRAEQGGAPLPPDPQTGQSDGGR
jgi:hypothetical protein